MMQQIDGKKKQQTRRHSCTSKNIFLKDNMTRKGTFIQRSNEMGVAKAAKQEQI